MKPKDIDSEIAFALQGRGDKIGFRANFDINPNIFADNKQLSKIASRDWQVVFGRRGAGKTTLLAIHAKRITQNSDPKVASIELCVSDFNSIVKRDEHMRENDFEMSQIHFANFMSMLANHLYRVFSENIGSSKFWKLYSIAEKEKKRRIENLAEQIVLSTTESTGVEIGAQKTRVTKNTNTRDKFKDGSASIGFSGGASLGGVEGPKLEAKAGFGIKNFTESKSTDQDNEIIKNFKYDYFKTRSLLIELLDVLGIECLYIFLDEWSELDRGASTEIQPYFADLMKRVFGNNSRFVVKIGAVRSQTRFVSKSKRKGLIGIELGADIFDIDLDDLYSQNKLLTEGFYEEMIFRHLLACNPELSMFQRQLERTEGAEGERGPIETFVTYIFKSPDVLRELVMGAGGLPRDFMEIFDSIAQTKRYSTNPRWSVKDAKQAIRSHCVKNKLSNVQSENSSLEVYQQMLRIISANNDRLLAVKSSEKRSILDILAYFHYNRLIHDVPLNDIPAILRLKYRIYHADLGLLYDSNGAHSDETSYFEGTTLTSLRSESEIDKYLIKAV